MFVILTVTNQKGGVGKTTVALNLGAALAEMGRSVVLVDTDPAAGLTYAVGFDPETIEPRFSTASLFRGEQPTLQALAKGLQILPVSPAALLELEREWARGRVEVKAEWFKGMGAIDDFIIDSPPNLGGLSVASLLASDSVVIPFIAEDASLGPMKPLLETIRAANKSATIIGAIPTIVDNRRKMTNEVIERMHSGYGLNILQGIPRAIALAETPRHTRSVLDFASRSVAAASFRKLATQVVAAHA